MFIPQQVSLPAGIHVIFIRTKIIIVMNSGKPGYLQFMSIENGKLIYNVTNIYFILFLKINFNYLVGYCWRKLCFTQ